MCLMYRYFTKLTQLAVKNQKIVETHTICLMKELKYMHYKEKKG